VLQPKRSGALVLRQGVSGAELIKRLEGFLRRNEYAKKIVKKIHELAPKAVERTGQSPIKIMDFCGTHEYTITHFGLRSLMPPEVELVAGPGCPVCITPAYYVDVAIKLSLEGIRVFTFGDAYKLPGSGKRGKDVRSLEEARAAGGNVVVVYGILDAIRIAKEDGKESVFFAVGFETKQCSGTIMRMNGVDERDYFSISIDTKNKLRFAYSFSHPGIKLEEDALMIDSKLADGKSFCNGKKHSFSIERMYDKVVYKVDGGKEIRQDVPKLSVRFKKPKEVIIGSTGRGRFEGCISGVKVTNWPTRKVKAGTVEPIKWALYDFSHSKDLKAFGVARQKCGPEPEVPPIPTRPIPGPHGPTTPPPGPPGGPEKGKRKIDDEYTAIIVIIVLLIILVIIAVLAHIYWYYAKHKGVYHTHEDEDQGKASEPFIDLQPLPAASSAPEEPQRKQEWFI